jgi:hypothetical protein
MMLAQWCSQHGGAHSDKKPGGGGVDRFGKIRCFGSLNAGRHVPRDDYNPGDKD